MVKNIKNPVLSGLDSICGGNDAAIARVFGVSRQSVGQWRKFESIPRHFMRTFSALTGVPVETLLEHDEVAHGVNFARFLPEAARKLKQEEKP